MDEEAPDQNSTDETVNDEVDETATNEETVADDTTATDEDRSAYNCADCSGEGLVNQTTVCPVCRGTGKV